MSRGYSHHAIGRVDVRDVPVYIYGLSDPDSGEVKYIGKSEKPSSRLSAHKSRSAATYVRAWVLDLQSAGKRPGLVILRVVPPGQDADVHERAEIAAHGPTLLNVRGNPHKRLPMLNKLTPERLRVVQHDNPFYWQRWRSEHRNRSVTGPHAILDCGAHDATGTEGDR